jgi:acyl carrier protein
MENKVKNLIAKIFNMDESQLINESSPNTIENWDSLKQMEIIVSIEEEFNIEFDDDEVLEIKDIDSILKIVERKI